MTFLKYVLAASVLIFAIAFYPIFIASDEYTITFLAGYGIALINVLLGYALIEYSLDKSISQFMVLVFGGMMIRMILVGGLLILIYYTANLDIIPLILFVMFFYFLFAGIEIFYINKRKPNNLAKKTVLNSK